MINSFYKFLADHPIAALMLLIAYVVSLWVVVVNVWNSGQHAVAVILFLIMAFLMKVNSAKIIERVKSAKQH